jgi:hypothetical protein
MQYASQILVAQRNISLSVEEMFTIVPFAVFSLCRLFGRSDGVNLANTGPSDNSRSRLVLFGRASRCHRLLMTRRLRQLLNQRGHVLRRAALVLTVQLW